MLNVKSAREKVAAVANRNRPQAESEVEPKSTIDSTTAQEFCYGIRSADLAVMFNGVPQSAIARAVEVNRKVAAQVEGGMNAKAAECAAAWQALSDACEEHLRRVESVMQTEKELATELNAASGRATQARYTAGYYAEKQRKPASEEDIDELSAWCGKRGILLSTNDWCEVLESSRIDELNAMHRGDRIVQQRAQLNHLDRNAIGDPRW